MGVEGTSASLTEQKGDVLFAAAQMHVAVSMANPDDLTSDDPVRFCLLRYFPGAERTYEMLLEGVARKVFAFVQRVVENPDTCRLSGEECALLADSLSRYQVYEQLVNAAVVSRIGSLPMDGVPASEVFKPFHWSQLNIRLRALQNSGG